MDSRFINHYINIQNTIKKCDRSVSTEDIENIICESKLFFDDRSGIYQNYSDHMISENIHQKEKVGLYQRPNQLAKYIRYLLDIDNIKSHLDIGTLNGVTFLIVREFLRLKNPHIHTKTIDPIKHISDNFIKTFDINYIKCDITNCQEKFDSVFIDGDHTYEYVKKDFTIAMRNNAKIIAFHDIYDKYCDDVEKFWGEVKKRYSNKIIEFKDKDKVMGIGIITN